jgi:hypothetical protein
MVGRREVKRRYEIVGRDRRDMMKEKKGFERILRVPFLFVRMLLLNRSKCKWLNGPLRAVAMLVADSLR